MKKIAAIIGVVLCLGLGVVNDTFAIDSPICADLKPNSPEYAAAGCKQTTTAGSVAMNIINIILSLVGVVTVIVIIYGGIMYSTSMGDAGKLAKAKNTIIFGVIGLVVALLAFAIVNFVSASMLSGNTGSATP